MTAMAKELKNPTQEGTFLWIGGLVRGEEDLTDAEAEQWRQTRKFVENDFGGDGIIYANLFDDEGKPRHDLRQAKAKLKE